MTLYHVPADAHDLVDLSDEELAAFQEIVEYVRDEPLLLPHIAAEDPELFAAIESYCSSQMLVDRALGWRAEGRSEQFLPGTPGAALQDTDWLVWLVLGGRGAGKSRTGAEATREILLGRNWTHDPQPALWACVGPTLEAVRAQMFSGALLNVLPPESIDYYTASTLEIGLTNGCIIRGYSSQSPNSLRGPNFVGAWADEIASWKDARKGPYVLDTTWSNLVLATRALDDGTWAPRIVATTTPKPVPLLRVKDTNSPDYPGLVDDDNVVMQQVRTVDNLANLPTHFRTSVIDRHLGTRLGKQELEGIILDDAEGALWSADTIASMRRTPDWPERHEGGLFRTVVAVDPSAGDGSGDECGIVVVGLAADRRAYVLADYSTRGPAEHWVPRVAQAFRDWRCNVVVCEYNNGLDLVENTIRRYAPNLPIEWVWAKKGKALRAEPVSMMSVPAQDRVRLAGDFPLLEAQMTEWEPFDVGGNLVDSPDRVDAFVYGVLYLLPPDADASSTFSVRGGGNLTR